MSGRYIINEKVTEYLDSFYHSPDDALGILRAEAEAEGVPVILRDTERFLTILVKILRPSRILEIGTATGYSSICLAKSAGASTEIITLEKEQELASRAVSNIHKLGFEEQIRVIAGDALVHLPELDGPFDLVFIDAAKSHYDSYWDLSFPLCRPGSVIVCDNVLLRGSVTDEGYDSSPRRHRTSIRKMRTFTEKITWDPAVETTVMTIGDGLSVSYVRTVGHE